MFHLFSRLFLQLLFPPYCCACGRLGSYLCDRCKLDVDFIFEPIQLPEGSPIDSVQVAFHFKPPMSSLVHAMKYQSVQEICGILGELIYYHTRYPPAEIVTSVPVAPSKERLRGFNQAKEIAVVFSKLAEIPYLDLLQKKTAKSSQASITDRRIRQRNISATHFQPISRKKVPRSVLLIDDVFTTGATVSACATVLKSMGVEQVHVLAVAHGA